MSGMLNELDSLEDVLEAITRGSSERLFKVVCTDGCKLNIKANSLTHAERIVKNGYDREIEKHTEEWL